MTPQELAEFRALAGLDAPSSLEQNKAWADQQIARTQPPSPPASPLDNLATRLNGTLRQPGTPPKPDEQKSNQSDPNLDGLADRLNSLLGSNNFKVQRLN